jgi:hypothetical protein
MDPVSLGGGVAGPELVAVLPPSGSRPEPVSAQRAEKRSRILDRTPETATGRLEVEGTASLWAGRAEARLGVRQRVAIKAGARRRDGYRGMGPLLGPHRLGHPGRRGRASHQEGCGWGAGGSLGPGSRFGSRGRSRRSEKRSCE